ncbi:MAG: CocE/NonD family hydrolase, partial [Candidatus Binatia bacterium]
GDHGHGGYAGRDRWDWFDIWLLDKPDATGLLDDPVVNTFEAEEDGTGVGTKSGSAWPFPDTQWTNAYLHENGVLDFEVPTGTEATDVYLSGISRHGYFLYVNDPPIDPPLALPPNFASDVTTARSLPDVADYESAPLESDLVIAGPIQMDLYASILGTDVDFFVSLSDVWPDGHVSYVQRGMLKASHRAIDPLRSYYVDGAGVSCTGDPSCEGLRMVQPYRPHTNPQPVIPGEILRYRIEIFPLGHVFRKDHRLLVQIHTPPVVDGIWGYTPSHQPAVVTVYHDAEHPSSIQLPVVTPDGPLGPIPPTCQVPAGFPCTPPSALDAVLGG